MTDKDKSNCKSFSPREIEIMAIAMQCIKGDIVIDYDKFTEMTGYKKSSAMVTWNRLRRKLKAMCGNNANDDAESVDNISGGDSAATIETLASKKRKIKDEPEAD